MATNSNVIATTGCCPRTTDGKEVHYVSPGKIRQQTRKSWREADNKAVSVKEVYTLAWTTDTDGPPAHTTASTILGGSGSQLLKMALGQSRTT